MKRVQRKAQNSKGKSRQPGTTSVRPSNHEEKPENDNSPANLTTDSTTTDVRADSSSSDILVENNGATINASSETQVGHTVDINQPSTSSSFDLQVANNSTHIQNNNPSEIEMETNDNNQVLTSENSPSDVIPSQDIPSTSNQEPNVSSAPPEPKIVAEYFFNMKLTPENRHPNADVIHVLLIPKGDENRLKLPEKKRVVRSFDIELDPNYKPCHNFRRIPFPTFPNDDSCSSQQSTSQRTQTTHSIRQPGTSGVSGSGGSFSQPAASSSQSNTRHVQGNIARTVRNRMILLTNRGLSEDGINQNLPSTSTSHEGFSVPHNVSLSAKNKTKKCNRRPSLPNNSNNIQRGPSLRNQTGTNAESFPVQGSSSTSELISPSVDRVSVNILYKKKKPDSRSSILNKIVNKPTLRNQTMSNIDDSPQSQGIYSTPDVTSPSVSSTSDGVPNVRENSDRCSSLPNNVGNVDMDTLRNEPMDNGYTSPVQVASSTSEVTSHSVSSVNVASKRNTNSEHTTSLPNNFANEGIEPVNQFVLRNEPVANVVFSPDQASSSTSEVTSTISVKRESCSSTSNNVNNINIDSFLRNEAKGNADTSSEQGGSSTDVTSFPSVGKVSVGETNKKKKSECHSLSKNVDIEPLSKKQPTANANTSLEQGSTSEVTSSPPSVGVKNKKRKSERQTSLLSNIGTQALLRNQTSINGCSALEQGSSSSFDITSPSVNTRAKKNKLILKNKTKKGKKK